MAYAFVLAQRRARDNARKSLAQTRPPPGLLCTRPSRLRDPPHESHAMGIEPVPPQSSKRALKKGTAHGRAGLHRARSSARVREMKPQRSGRKARTSARGDKACKAFLGVRRSSASRHATGTEAAAAVCLQWGGRLAHRSTHWIEQAPRSERMRTLAKEPLAAF